MSHSQINSLIKAVKDEINTKMTKRLPTLRLLHLPLFRKSGGETISAVNTKKLWLSSWCFPSRKSPNCHPRTGFCTGRSTKSTSKPLSRSPCRRKVSLCLFTALADFFFSSRGQSLSWLTSRCPRTASRQVQRGSSEPVPKMSPPIPSGGNRLLRKIRPLWL